jgi:hypothetical protein
MDKVVIQPDQHHELFSAAPVKIHQETSTENTENRGDRVVVANFQVEINAS